MRDFEKWAVEHGYSIMDRRPDDSKHPRYPAIQTEAAWQAWQFAYRAGMRAAAEIARKRDLVAYEGNMDAHGIYIAILAEADKP